MNEHKVKLNYIIIEDNKGHDILRFSTIDECEKFFEDLQKYAVKDLYTIIPDFTAFYNVNIDGMSSLDLTSNQYYDGEDIELDDGTYINL